jgi:hypothetical protein
VIWVLTILTFLASAIALMFLFIVFETRPPVEKPRNAAHHRTEPRAWAAVDLELSTVNGPKLRETTVTENVSHHGACALTAYHWLPDTVAQVRFLYEDVSVRARVAYCSPSRDAFVVGLQFSTAIDLWLPPAIWLGHRTY